jgi:hypothetical protein
MALEFAHGAIQWGAADTAGTTYTVSGLAFQPKALRFYWVGIQSAVDGAIQIVDIRRGVGFATGTSARRAVGTFSDDGLGTSDCGSVAADDCVVVTCDGAGARTGMLDLTAINSDGFVLTVDGQAPVAITVFWEAWGGSDITVQVVGDIAEPAATGDQDYTATGFVAGATDQVVMFAGVQSVSALNTAEAQDSGLHVGFATGASNNITMCGNSDDASGTMDTDRYFRSGECLSMIVVGGGNPDARASLTQFGTDNFRLNWTARALTNRRSIFLAIKGGQWSTGLYTIDPATVGATATVSGLSFAPVGLSTLYNRGAESAAGTSAVSDLICFGSGSSTSSRRAMGSYDENAGTNSEADLAIEFDEVVVGPDSSGGVASAFDIDAMNSDGFRIICDVAEAGSPTYAQGYLTFGSAAVGGGRTTKNTRAFPLGMEIGMNRLGGLAA